MREERRQRVVDKIDKATRAIEALKQARKGLGIWATNHRFLASVANSNATTLFLEDDTLLTPSFCTHTTRALRTIASLPTWDLLLPGHCGGVRDRNCSRILGTNQQFPTVRDTGTLPHVHTCVHRQPTRRGAYACAANGLAPSLRRVGPTHRKARLGNHRGPKGEATD